MRSRLSGYSLVGALVAAVACVGEAWAQDPMQQQLAAIRQAMTANTEALHHYTWVETTQMSYKGEVKSVQQARCEYGPDSKVVKSPMGAPEQSQSKPRGPLRRHMVDKKTAEIAEYMDSVKILIGEYVPPQPPRLQLAFQAGNASMTPVPPATVTFTFKNYAQAGDTLTLSFDQLVIKLTALDVSTWYKDPKGVITFSVQWATLPDGTSYPNQTVLVAEAENVKVTVTNSDYEKFE